MSDTPEQITREMRTRIEDTRHEVYRIAFEMRWQRDVLIFIALGVASIAVKVFFL